jgi:hypothetical protein
MKVPNKIISYKNSILSKFPFVLDKLQNGEYEICSLYNVVKDDMEDIAEFIDILDSLFALGKIRYNDNKRSVYYVK